jgi:hypothetical protein
MGEIVNASELARRLDVSEGAIRKATKRGLLRRDRSGGYDLEKAKAAWETGRDPDAVLKGIAGGEAVSSRPGGAGMETSLSKARAANAVLQAQRQKLALDRARGEVISKRHALEAVRAVVTVTTERLDGAAAQIAPRVAGMINVAEIEKICREVINGARSEIAKMAEAIEVVADVSPKT